MYMLFVFCKTIDQNMTMAAAQTKQGGHHPVPSLSINQRERRLEQCTSQMEYTNTIILVLNVSLRLRNTFSKSVFRKVLWSLCSTVAMCAQMCL